MYKMFNKGDSVDLVHEPVKTSLQYCCHTTRNIEFTKKCVKSVNSKKSKVMHDLLHDFMKCKVIL